MKKIALVYSFQESDWFSCTVICRNLITAYELAYGKENVLHIDYTRYREVSVNDLKLIFTEKIDRLIFIDHKPTPITFIERLMSVKSDKTSWPEMTVHVFGDYPLYLTEWRSFNQIMKGLRVKYITASERQANYLANYVAQKELIQVSPFPVDTQKFRYKEGNGELRAKLKIAKDAQIFIYTGRLSYQKRIVELVSTFLSCKRDKKIGENSYLILIGECDNLGQPYLSYTQLQGEYYRSIQHILEEYDDISDSVILTGNLKNDVLVEYYNTANAFISFRTYHDEDYGMSVAEALCCGLPLILTDWAGYYSFNFKEIKDQLIFVPVKLGKELPVLDENDLQNAIQNFSNKEINCKEIENTAKKYLSIEAVSERLKKIGDISVPAYEGGTDVMVQMTNEQYLRHNEFLRSETTREFNHFYYKVYDAYIK